MNTNNLVEACIFKFVSGYTCKVIKINSSGIMAVVKGSFTNFRKNVMENILNYF